VPPAKAGMGSGINTTFRQVGIATGVASLGAVFQSQVDSKLSTVLPGALAGLAEAVASGGSCAAAGVAPPASVLNSCTPPTSPSSAASRRSS